LHDDESIGCLHEPRLDLVDAVFPVVPNRVHAIVIIAFIPAVDDVCSIAFNPLIPLVICNVEVAGDMSLDKERSDTVSC
jgi:hypothetical protein